MAQDKRSRATNLARHMSGLGSGRRNSTFTRLVAVATLLKFTGRDSGSRRSHAAQLCPLPKTPHACSHAHTLSCIHSRPYPLTLTLIAIKITKS